MLKIPGVSSRRMAGIAALFLVFSTLSQAAEASLKVGIAGENPFVSFDTNPPSGAALDVWQEVAAANKWTFNAVAFPDIKTGLDAVANGTVDILIGDVPITHSGLEKVEFSQPYFHSGLQILLPNEKKTSAFGFLLELEQIIHLPIFWILIGIGLIFTVVVYLFEKKHNPDFPKNRKEGFAEAFYYVATLALTGKSAYKGFTGVLGRLVMILWIVLGIVLVSYVTSIITSAMTVEKLRSKIHGPDDLKGKCVAVVTKSSGEAYMLEKGISHVSFPTLIDAVNSMLRGEADAVVDEVADVQTIDIKRPDIPVTVVGPIFARVNFGFAFAIGSPLRIPFNRALVSIGENGVLDRIFVGYFGSDYQH